MGQISFRVILAAASLYGGAATAATFAPKGYTYTAIVVPGAYITGVSAINAAGTVIGGWYDQDFTEHGYIFQNGTVTSFDDPEAVNGTIPSGINASGEIVGSYYDASYGEHGFTYVPSTGTFTTVDLAGANYTGLSGIDSKGAIIGVAAGADNTQIVFSYAKGKFKTLPISGSPVVYNVSDTGSIAGTYFNTSPTTAFVYVKGVATTLPLNAPGGAFAYAVNSHGAVVGDISDASYDESGYIYADGVATAVTLSGATNTILTDINDGGTAVGTGYDQYYDVLGSFIYKKGKLTTMSDPAGTNTSALYINNAGQVTGTYDDATYGPIVFLATPAK